MNKNKCKSCKYCGRITTIGIHCNYSLSGQTCLTIKDGKVVDRRGYKYNNCLLYERGN
jgi:hypothetical protein